MSIYLEGLGKIRHTLYRDPISAILQAAESGCEVERDYVCAHLEIPPGEWEGRFFVARRRARILAAQSWSDGLLDGLPSPILRWFAADCAEHRSLDERGDDEAVIRALIAVRLYALGRMGAQEVVAAAAAIQVAASGYDALGFDYRDAGSVARSAAMDAARSAAMDAARSAASAARGAARSAAWDAASAASAATSAAWDAASAASAAEANWQLDRLAYLAGAWALHGEAALVLLWEGLI